MSDRVENHEDRFSRVAALIKTYMRKCPGKSFSQWGRSDVFEHMGTLLDVSCTSVVPLALCLVSRLKIHNGLYLGLFINY